MQNAQNLMSSFEFIAALMSIIVGLGVTNLLAGAGRAFYRRKENPLDEVHIVLTLATLLLLVLQWWVTFKWNTEVTWSFDRFLVLIVSFCRPLRPSGCHRSHCTPPRLRSLLCVVPTHHAVSLGARRTKISRGRHDDGVKRAASSALNRHPFVPRTRIGNSLHDAHVANAVFEIRMRKHASL